MISAADVARLIREHDANRPRSRQVDVGPSQLGDVCTRKLAYHALRLPHAQRERDILPAWVGTQAHEGMREIVHAKRWEGWQAELEVEIPGHGVVAHVDAYHEPSGLVVDWKFVSDASLRKYRATMSAQYRAQVQLYGYAISSTLLLPVRDVAVVLIPRNGPLSGVHVWAEPYDERVALDALRRWTNIRTVVDAYGVDALAKMPTHPDAHCEWCPWWNPGGGSLELLVVGCPGVAVQRGSAPAPWEEQQPAATAAR